MKTTIGMHGGRGPERKRGRGWGRWPAVIAAACWALLIGGTAYRIWAGDRLRSAESAYQSRDIVGCLRYASDYLLDHPDDLRAHRLAARCLSLRVFPREAEAHYLAASGTDALSLDDWHLRAQGFARAGLTSDAIALYQQILEQFPEDPLALKRWASLAFERHEHDQAYDLARRLAAAVDAESLDAAEAEYLMFAVSHAAKERERAIAHGDRLLVKDPQLRAVDRADRNFWPDYAEMLIAIGQSQRARGLLEKVVNRTDNIRIKELLSYAYILEGQWDRARALSRQLVEKSPDHVLGWLFLGQIALRRGETDEAIAILEQAKATFPGVYPIVNTLLAAHAQAGHREQAQRLRSEVARLRALVPESQSGMGAIQPNMPGILPIPAKPQ